MRRVERGAVPALRPRRRRVAGGCGRVPRALRRASASRRSRPASTRSSSALSGAVSREPRVDRLHGIDGLDAERGRDGVLRRGDPAARPTRGARGDADHRRPEPDGARARAGRRAERHHGHRHGADVRPYLEAAVVVVVPLRIGGGTRIKIYEAMGMERAVVSTTIGAEGLDSSTASTSCSPTTRRLRRRRDRSAPRARRARGDRPSAPRHVRAHFGWASGRPRQLPTAVVAAAPASGRPSPAMSMSS